MADKETEERNALLDELSSAVETWYQKEVETTNNEIALLKQIGKGSANKLASSNTTAGRVLALNDIESFLARG